MELIHLSLIPASLRKAFHTKVIAIAERLGVNPNWLMQVMYMETAHTMRADIQNAKSGATGLIQFMPNTAIGLGTTVESLKKLDHVSQLTYVEKYFIPYRGKMHSYYDVYAVVFFPAVIGKPDTWVLSTSRLSAQIIARQNPAINKNKDGVITVAEFKSYVFNSVATIYAPFVFDVGEIVKKKVLS